MLVVRQVLALELDPRAGKASIHSHSLRHQIPSSCRWASKVSCNPTMEAPARGTDQHLLHKSSTDIPRQAPSKDITPKVSKTIPRLTLPIDDMATMGQRPDMSAKVQFSQQFSSSGQREQKSHRMSNEMQPLAKHADPMPSQKPPASNE